MNLDEALREYRESLEMEAAPNLTYLFEDAPAQAPARKKWALVAAGLAVAAALALVFVLRPQVAAPMEETAFVEIAETALLPQPQVYQMVRVELDEARLVALGLREAPISPRGRVKAQVLLGEDGIARAIRILDTVNVQ